MLAGSDHQTRAVEGGGRAPGVTHVHVGESDGVRGQVGNNTGSTIGGRPPGARWLLVFIENVENALGGRLSLGAGVELRAGPSEGKVHLRRQDEYGERSAQGHAAIE